MVLRRFREHVIDHNWFAVAIDLMIVVVGVFLGTQANNWNQDRIERATATDYRRQILANIEVNEVDLTARIAYYDRVRQHAVAALRALQNRGAALGEPFLMDAYHGSQVWLRPFERTAYDEMLSNGVASDIGSASLRGALSGYYVGARGFDTTVQSTTPYRERLRRIMDFDVQQGMSKHCNDIVRHLPTGGQIAILNDQCKLGLDPALIAKSARKIQMAPQLDEDLTRNIVDLDQKLALFERMLRSAHQLRHQLESASS